MVFFGKTARNNLVFAYEAYLTNGFDDTVIENLENRTWLPASKAALSIILSTDWVIPAKPPSTKRGTIKIFILVIRNTYYQKPSSKIPIIKRPMTIKITKCLALIFSFGPKTPVKRHFILTGMTGYSFLLKMSSYSHA